MITENIKDNTETNEDAVDGAIDEAIKAETEKLYEEACSNISSCSGICPSHPDFCLLNQLLKERKIAPIFTMTLRFLQITAPLVSLQSAILSVMHSI